jgi:hypothetical protein
MEEIRTREPLLPRQFDRAVPKELDRICLKALAKRASRGRRWPWRRFRPIEPATGPAECRVVLHRGSSGHKSAAEKRRLRRLRGLVKRGQEFIRVGESLLRTLGRSTMGLKSGSPGPKRRLFGKIGS